MKTLRINLSSSDERSVGIDYALSSDMIVGVRKQPWRNNAWDSVIERISLLHVTIYLSNAPALDIVFGASDNFPIQHGEELFEEVLAILEAK